MPDQAERNSGPNGIELVEKNMVQSIDDASSGDEATLQRTDTSMNKAKWLACVALCLAYTTAYQQNACTSAILKHIDEKLGVYHDQVAIYQVYSSFLGPTTYYNWMLTAYTISVSISLPISGGLSDSTLFRIYSRYNANMAQSSEEDDLLYAVA